MLNQLSCSNHVTPVSRQCVVCVSLRAWSCTMLADQELCWPKWFAYCLHSAPYSAGTFTSYVVVHGAYLSTCHALLSCHLVFLECKGMIWHCNVAAGPVQEEVFENERFQPFKGWGHNWPGHFLPTDRIGHWSHRDGTPGKAASMAFSTVAPKLPKVCFTLLPA